MHRLKDLIWMLLLAATPVLAADDAVAVAARAQSAWLRGAGGELAQLASAHARWSTSTVATEQYALALLQFRVLQSLSGAKNESASTRAGEACIAAASQAATLARTGALAAEAWAIQSSCHGYLAGVGGTFAAIRNGRASGKSMERALAADARNPRVLLVDALGLYFRPKIAGGDKLKACARFREAVAAFDRPGVAAALAPLGNWGAAEANYWQGRCLADASDAAGARRAYERALQLAPEFAAARRALR